MCKSSRHMIARLRGYPRNLQIECFASGLVGTRNSGSPVGQSRVHSVIRWAIAQARDFTVRRLMVGTARTNGRVIFRLALHFAHRAFCAAAILLRAAADIFLLRAVMDTTFGPLTFAQGAR